MARTLPFHDRLTCIECGQPHRRVVGSWRCWPCDKQVLDARQRAMRSVLAAIKAGRLQPAGARQCHYCGADARDYEHRSYLRPLEVTPTCRSCNLMRGPAIWRDTGGAVTLDEMLPDPAWPHVDGRPCIDVAAPVKEAA